MNRDFRRPWDGVDGQDFDHWMDKEMLRGQGASVHDDVLSIHSNADVPLFDLKSLHSLLSFLFELILLLQEDVESFDL